MELVEVIKKQKEIVETSFSNPDIWNDQAKMLTKIGPDDFSFEKGAIIPFVFNPPPPPPADNPLNLDILKGEQKQLPDLVLTMFIDQILAVLNISGFKSIELDDKSLKFRFELVTKNPWPTDWLSWLKSVPYYSILVYLTKSNIKFDQKVLKGLTQYSMDKPENKTYYNEGQKQLINNLSKTINIKSESVMSELVQSLLTYKLNLNLRIKLESKNMKNDEEKMKEMWKKYVENSNSNDVKGNEKIINPEIEEIDSADVQSFLNIWFKREKIEVKVESFKLYEMSKYYKNVIVSMMDLNDVETIVNVTLTKKTYSSGSEVILKKVVLIPWLYSDKWNRADIIDEAKQDVKDMYKKKYFLLWFVYTSLILQRKNIMSGSFVGMEERAQVALRLCYFLFFLFYTDDYNYKLSEIAIFNFGQDHTPLFED